MQRHASALTNPEPPCESRCRETPQPEPAGRPKPGRSEQRAGSKWLTGYLFANSCSDPCNATNQPSRIPSPQARAAARSTPAGARRAAQGQEKRAADGSKWLIGSLLANAAAPIHETPCVNLHESPPKRVALPATRQPGPAGRPKAGRSERRTGSRCAFILSCSKSVRTMLLQPVKAYS